MFSELSSLPLPDNTFMRGSVEVRRSTEEEQQEYLQYLQEVVNELKRILGDEGWWIIGGMSRDAHLGNADFVVKSPDGAWRDVDILVTTRNQAKLKEFQTQYQGPLSVGGGALQSCMYIDDASVTLQYGGVREAVPRETFDTEQVRLGTVDFPSVPLATLFHLYAVGDRPHGRMREKDFLNALDIGRHMRSHPDTDHPEELYAEYHRFARRKNNTDEVGYAQRLRRAIIWYKESKFNKMFPIDGPQIRPVLEHVWKMMGDFQVSMNARA